MKGTIVEIIWMYTCFGEFHLFFNLKLLLKCYFFGFFSTYFYIFICILDCNVIKFLAS
jgi:hypothetical protein